MEPGYGRAGLWLEIDIVVHIGLRRDHGLFLPQEVAFLKLQGRISRRQMSLRAMFEPYSKLLITLSVYTEAGLSVLLPDPCVYIYSYRFRHQSEVLLDEKHYARGNPASVQLAS